MASLSDVTVGSPTLASNINQIIDLLNGTVAGAITLLATSATTANNPLNAAIPAAPAADASVIESFVSGDAVARLATYVRSADGYGGIWAGKGPSITAHWYAQANGWKTDESVTIAGALTVNGGLTLSSVNASGNIQGSGTLQITGSSSLDNGNIITDGTGILQTKQNFGWAKTLASANQQIINIQPPDVGAHRWGFNYNTDNTLNWYDYTTAFNAMKLDGNGNLSTASGTFSNPAVNALALNVAGTNGQGSRVARIADAATLNQNADLLDLTRTNNQTATFTLGIDPSNGFYLYDVNNAAFVWSGANKNGINFTGVVKSNGGSAVAISGSHSAGQTIISYGTGQPASLAANEIFIQLS